MNAVSSVYCNKHITNKLNTRLQLTSFDALVDAPPRFLVELAATANKLTFSLAEVHRPTFPALFTGQQTAIDRPLLLADNHWSLANLIHSSLLKCARSWKDLRINTLVGVPLRS